MSKTTDLISRSLIVTALLFQIVILSLLVYGFITVRTLSVYVSELKVPVTHYYIPVQEKETDLVADKILSEKENIQKHISDISALYGIDKYLIESMVYHESSYKPKTKTGSCIGLMQINPKWHKDRMLKLGVTDLYDPYQNILVGTDYINELLVKYKDPKLALMMYNMNHETALINYKAGKISYYAKSVLKMSENLRKGE